MTFSISAVQLSDLPLLMPIENACHSHPWSEKLFASCISGNYFAELFQDTTNNANLVVGYYVGQYVAGEATLMNICVPPAQQGNGIGKKILQRFINTAKAKGASQLFLEVRAKNIAAQMMYINAGFSEIARRTGYYPSAKGFGYEDAIVMAKKI